MAFCRKKKKLEFRRQKSEYKIRREGNEEVE
jgi:hypothetical protein